MENNHPELSEQTLQTLLSMLAPGSVLISFEVAEGSFSNYTHILTAKLKDGTPYKAVVRRYKVFGAYDRGEKAQREFKAFELLNQHQVPAPEALYLDSKGEVLGIPGIVTRFVEGQLLMDNIPMDAIEWAHKLARVMAKVHAIPCGEAEQQFLLKGNAEAAWVAKYDEPPQYMQDYPGGVEVWRFLKELFPKIDPEPPVLLHLDFWSGNILWHAGEISAVIDWEEAAYGDPAVDVGYARMNMVLMGLPEAADEFLRMYEAETGCEIKNLGFWELAASVRPMLDPVDWKIAGKEGLNTDIFLKFIEDAKRKI